MFDIFVNLIAVSIGGAIGAESRYYVSGKVKFSKPIPFGTYTVNVLGSFGLGAFGVLSNLLSLPHWLALLIGTGFFGCFTTMSTFAVESLGLSEESKWLAIENISIMLVSVLLGALTGETIIQLIK